MYLLGPCGVPKEKWELVVATVSGTVICIISRWIVFVHFGDILFPRFLRNLPNQLATISNKPKMKQNA